MCTSSEDHYTKKGDKLKRRKDKLLKKFEEFEEKMRRKEEKLKRHLDAVKELPKKKEKLDLPPLEDIRLGGYVLSCEYKHARL